MKGFISKEEFERCCHDICTLSKKFQDSFVLRTDQVKIFLNSFKKLQFLVC